MRSYLIVIIVLLTISLTLAEQNHDVPEEIIYGGIRLRCPKFSGAGACIEACDNCAADELCCGNGCGHVCTKGVPVL
ncbi:hypothetical protein CYY_001955 [Polysphondylium violaceum]|uniref:WAP domain-containing protein n=1 Tax=Polysphondylium violaceum TaxID=133409 RepID=A0A8J4Q8J3_9MYCE|nr:hypothetical protein CYY_001955 [Polysphondylium violaceum]